MGLETAHVDAVDSGTGEDERGISGGNSADELEIGAVGIDAVDFALAGTEDVGLVGVDGGADQQKVADSTAGADGIFSAPDEVLLN